MPKKILIVEDEVDACDLLVLWYQKEGYQALAAHDGQEGFDLALVEQPDLIITDVAMPNLDGIDMLTRLRQAPPIAAVPVIVLTAYHREKFAEAVCAGADAMLQKPVAIDCLLQITRELLATP